MEAMMDSKVMQRIRFDVRLKDRRGWTSQEAFEEELVQLPDVSRKMQLPDEDDRASGEPSAQAGSPETGEV